MQRRRSKRIGGRNVSWEFNVKDSRQTFERGERVALVGQQLGYLAKGL